MATEAKVAEVVGMLHQMVVEDGGAVSLKEYNEPAGRVVVDYNMGSNEECNTCVITPDMLNAFLAEALRSNGVEFESLIVDATEAPSQ